MDSQVRRGFSSIHIIRTLIHLKAKPMKHLLLLCACLAAVGTGFSQFPYNPDVNSDEYISTTDLIDFLPLFGSPFFVQAEEPVVQACRFDQGPCYVDESTDIVLAVYAPTDVSGRRIVLPEDESMKQLTIVQDGDDLMGWAEVIGRCSKTGDACLIYRHLGAMELGVFLRTPSGYWRSNFMP